MMKLKVIFFVFKKRTCSKITFLIFFHRFIETKKKKTDKSS